MSNWRFQSLKSLNLLTSLRGRPDRGHHSHFPEEETEAQRIQGFAKATQLVSGSSSHSRVGVLLHEDKIGALPEHPWWLRRQKGQPTAVFRAGRHPQLAGGGPLLAKDTESKPP